MRSSKVLLWEQLHKVKLCLQARDDVVFEFWPKRFEWSQVEGLTDRDMMHRFFMRTGYHFKRTTYFLTGTRFRFHIWLVEVKTTE